MNQKSLFTTKATEPVDLKAALTPVSGNSIKVDFSEWTEIMSSEGHPYYVIATLPNGLRVSFRMWKEASDRGTTRLCFRVRFGDMVGAIPTPEAFEEIVKLQDKWTSAFKKDSMHRSVMGAFSIPAPAWDVPAVLDSVMSEGLPAQLYYMFGEVCPFGTVFCGETKFLTLFAMFTARVLQDMIPPPKPATGPAYLSWGPGASPIIDTSLKAKHSEAAEAINKAKANGTYLSTSTPAKVYQPSSPQPFAAPHPKDKLKAVATETLAAPAKPAKAKTATKPAKTTPKPLH